MRVTPIIKLIVTAYFSPQLHGTGSKKVLKELAPALVVAVAVSEEKESVEILSRFAVGAVPGEAAIDVLLVKQMASIGLDVDHLKVGLDLSNIRSYSGLFQQMMRIATRWDDPYYPDKPVLTAVYIAPDEPFIEEIIERIRKDEGDIAILVPPPPGGCGPIDVPPIGPGPTPRKTLFFPEGGELSGNLANLTDAAAPATYVVPADKFFERFPGAKQNVDKADFADWLQTQGVSPASEPTDTDRGHGQISGHTNIREELNRWRGLVSDEGKRAINRRYRKAFGTSDWKAWKDEYRNITIDFWVEHKQKVGADYASTKLEDIDEVETLKKMFKNIQEELAA